MPRRIFQGDIKLYNLRMEPELFDAIEATALKSGRSINAEMVQALQNWVRRSDPNFVGPAKPRKGAGK